MKLRRSVKLSVVAALCAGNLLSGCASLEKSPAPVQGSQQSAPGSIVAKDAPLETETRDVQVKSREPEEMVAKSGKKEAAHVDDFVSVLSAHESTLEQKPFKKPA